MALIKCPECNHDVSDEAKTCPFCGYPIAEKSPSGIVRIKLNPLKSGNGISGRQNAEIFDDHGNLLWNGTVGDTAELHFDGRTRITIHYKFSLCQYGGYCSAYIDPAKSKKYTVIPRQGFYSTNLLVQVVDVFDAD